MINHSYPTAIRSHTSNDSPDDSGGDFNLVC